MRNHSASQKGNQHHQVNLGVSKRSVWPGIGRWLFRPSSTQKLRTSAVLGKYQMFSMKWHHTAPMLAALLHSTFKPFWTKQARCFQDLGQSVTLCHPNAWRSPVSVFLYVSMECRVPGRLQVRDFRRFNDARVKVNLPTACNSPSWTQKWHISVQ